MYCSKQLLLQQQHQEELLTENSERWVMFPIKYHAIWQLYKNAQNSFWAAENFRFTNDLNCYKSLDQEIIKSLINTLHYYVEMDNNPVLRPCIFTCELINQVQIPEVRAFYGFQIMFENVHSEAFGSLLNTIYSNATPVSIPNNKCLWAKTNLDKDNSFFEKIFCNMLIKVIFSTGLFIIKNYLNKNSLCIDTVSAFDKIENDIVIQSKFTTTLIKMCKYKLEQPLIYELVNDAINTEIAFLNATIDLGKLDTKIDDVFSYLKATADDILICTGYQPMFSVKNNSNMKILDFYPVSAVEKSKQVDYGNKQVVTDEDF